MMLAHPKGYGNYVEGFHPIFHYPGYFADNTCKILGPYRKILRPNPHGQVTLKVNGERLSKNVTHLTLMAIFPHVQPLDEVDHIDGNHSNNNVTNLQWLTRADHAEKSAKDRKPKGHEKLSKKTYQLDGPGGNVICEFNSALEASKKLGIQLGSICSSARCGGFVMAKGHYFSYEIQQDLEGEFWQTSDALDIALNQQAVPDEKKVKVSNKGRVLYNHGQKTRGGIHKQKRYRMVSIGRDWRVHQLVFMGFYNRRSPERGERDENGNIIVINHDDRMKDEEGYPLNYPEYLSLKTHGKNMEEWHKENKRKRDD